MNTLKKLILAALLFITPAALAANFTLEWDHDAPVTDQISFILERKDTPTGLWVVTHTLAPGVKEGDVANVPAGTYTFRVTAVSPEGLKSEPSNELIVKVPAGARNLKVKIR